MNNSQKLFIWGLSVIIIASLIYVKKIYRNNKLDNYNDGYCVNDNANEVNCKNINENKSFIQKNYKKVRDYYPEPPRIWDEQEITIDELRHWLDSGLSVNSVDQLNGTPLLTHIVRSGDVQKVKLLLDRGAKVNCYTDLSIDTPLSAASICGNLKIFKLLCEHGAATGTHLYFKDGEYVDINDNDFKNISEKSAYVCMSQSLLSCALRDPNLTVFNYLIEQSGSYNEARKLFYEHKAFNRNLLEEAIAFGSDESIEALIRLGDKPEPHNIAYMIENGRSTALESILNKGIIDKSSLNTPRSLAAAIQRNNLQTLHILAELGSYKEINMLSVKSEISDANVNTLEVIKEDFNFDFSKLDNKILVLCKKTESLSYLLDNGMRAPDELPTAINQLKDYISEASLSSNIEMLLNKGVKLPTHLDPDAGSSSVKYIRALTEAGFNPFDQHITDPDGNSLLALAIAKNNQRLVNFLNDLKSRQSAP
ncbi:MAG: hypothetical protein RL095_3802 [Verrucomicrobiota bacterium]|jgi:ankyrin repeat protein